jgi:hypothetical protein
MEYYPSGSFEESDTDGYTWIQLEETHKDTDGYRINFIYKSIFLQLLLGMLFRRSETISILNFSCREKFPDTARQMLENAVCSKLHVSFPTTGSLPKMDTLRI